MYLILALIILALLLLLAFGPQLWVRSVMARHWGDRPDLPGTGGELARHLLDEANLQHVRVLRTDKVDHYDPQKECVQLSDDNHDRRSLTAVAVATHEVAHAVQHADRYPPLEQRTRWAGRIGKIQRIGSILLFATPFAGALSLDAGIFLLTLGAGFALMSVSSLIHALTLPVELDASFNRALPVLRNGGYLSEKDLPAAEQVLKAAAYTYLASSFFDPLNVLRWIRVLRS